MMGLPLRDAWRGLVACTTFHLPVYTMDWSKPYKTSLTLQKNFSVDSDSNPVVLASWTLTSDTCAPWLKYCASPMTVTHVPVRRGDGDAAGEVDTDVDDELSW